MKFNSIKAMSIVIIAGLLSCNTSKKINAEKSPTEKKELDKESSSQNWVPESDCLTLSCDTDTLILKGRDQLTLNYQLNSHFIGKCIFTKAFHGNTEMEQLLLNSYKEIHRQKGKISLPWSETRFRGQPIFDYLMELANDFECQKNSAVGPYTMSKRYRRYIFEMIKTIDGLTVREFLKKESENLEIENNPYYMDLVNPESCGALVSKYEYNLLKIAIESNLVILKVYGEE